MTSPPHTKEGGRAADLSHMDGWFVGSLSDDELAAFDEAVERGEACRSYEGVLGFMGSAKERFLRSAISLAQPQGAEDE